MIYLPLMLRSACTLLAFQRNVLLTKPHCALAKSSTSISHLRQTSMITCIADVLWHIRGRLQGQGAHWKSGGGAGVGSALLASMLQAMAIAPSPRTSYVTETPTSASAEGVGASGRPCSCGAPLGGGGPCGTFSARKCAPPACTEVCK